MKATSTILRAEVRARIQKRLIKTSRAGAARRLGMSIAQTSRLMNDYDAFSLDRLVDAAKRVGLRVRISV